MSGSPVDITAVTSAIASSNNNNHISFPVSGLIASTGNAAPASTEGSYKKNEHNPEAPSTPSNAPPSGVPTFATLQPYKPNSLGLPINGNSPQTHDYASVPSVAADMNGPSAVAPYYSLPHMQYSQYGTDPLAMTAFADPTRNYYHPQNNFPRKFGLSIRGSGEYTAGIL